MTDSPADHLSEKGIGSWLAASRESRGISLEDAARTTRISKSYLDALEKEDFARLPAPAYCKGFLRLYAGFLALSPDEAVARYDRTNASSKVQVPGGQGDTSRSGDGGRPKRRLRWGLPLTLMLAVVLLSLVIDTDQRPQLNRPAPPQPVPAVTPSAGAVHAVASSSRRNVVQREETETQQPAQTDAKPFTPPVEQGQEGMILTLKVNQDCWLNIDIDGHLSRQYQLKSGDLIEWKADRLITLDIGNAGGVEGELNGKPLPSFGAPGKTAHVVLSPEGSEVH